MRLISVIDIYNWTWRSHKYELFPRLKKKKHQKCNQNKCLQNLFFFVMSNLLKLTPYLVKNIWKIWTHTFSAASTLSWGIVSIISNNSSNLFSILVNICNVLQCTAKKYAVTPIKITTFLEINFLKNKIKSWRKSVYSRKT